MKLTLDQLPVGKMARIAQVLGAGDSITRLMEMGLVTGSVIRVERTAPFGCPIAIRLKGTCIAIRRHDARKVVLELQPA
jgi:Fe2+ transport system protein FeoA